MTKRRLATVLLVLGAGVLSGAGAWYRLSRVNRESDPVRYWMAEGARAYSSLPTVPVLDSNELAQAAAAATVEDAEGVVQGRPELLDQLRATVFQFLSTRFAASSAEDYAAWMQSRGYRFKSPEEFEKRYGPLSDQAELSGLDSKEVPALFAAMWASDPSRRAMPNAICRGREAMTITLGHSNHNRFATQDLSGVLGFDLWHGGAGATCRFWMQPPVTREELVALHGEVVSAQVGVIACVPGFVRRPLIVNLFLEPDSTRWWIDGVSVTNYVVPGSRACIEY